jgi:AraC-like DNA-binding protein
MFDFFTESHYRIGDFPELERFCRASFVDLRIAERYNELLYEGELITLFARLSDKVCERSERRDRSRIDRAIAAMNSSLSPRLSNSELSELCGLNKHYFIKLFKKLTGLTPGRYREQMGTYK